MRDKANNKVRVELMLDSIANIEKYLEGVSNYDQFAGNKMLCHAVIYNLQCLGESVYMLTQDYREAHPGANWNGIERLRHVLVHDYYQVETETLWGIIQQDLQPLKQYLQSILTESS